MSQTPEEIKAEAEKAEAKKIADVKAEAEKKTPSTFSQDQVDAMIAKRIGETKAKTDQTIAEKVAEATADAERKAKLSQEERDKEETAKREKDTNDRETKIALRESGVEAKEIMQSKGIPTDLVEYVVDVDLDKTKSNIDSLETVFNKAVEAKIADQLKGKTPTDKGGERGDGKTAPTGRVAF
jgi:hypothetical protein